MRRSCWWVLAVVLLASCSRAAAQQPGMEQPLVDTAGTIRLPLDRYVASAADVAEMGRGYRALLHRCMASFGYDFPPAGLVGPAGPSDRNESRYGLTDAVAAATRGYRPAGNRAVPKLPDLPAPAQAALNGDAATVGGHPVPAGGCGGQASRGISGAVPAGADPTLGDQLASESFARSRADARVTAAISRWSACMGAAGHPYRSPTDPPRDPAFRGPLTAAEKATATADVRCKEQTGLVAAWAAVEAEYQRALIASNAGALDRAARAVHAEVAAARAALNP